MPFVSVTRLRLRGARYLPAFALHSWRSARQLPRTPGFLAGRLASGSGRAYWTVTVWESEAAMRAYRGAGAHRGAMPRLLDWCDEAAVAHWAQPAAELPPLDEAARRLRESMAKLHALDLPRLSEDEIEEAVQESRRERRRQADDDSAGDDDAAGSPQQRP